MPEHDQPAGEPPAPSVEDRLRALELGNLQLRTEYLQIQVQLLRIERGSDPGWSDQEDPDVRVLNDQIDLLRDRILAFEA